MKHGTGTNTGTIIYTRKRQRGNVACKNCMHLKYCVKSSKGIMYNYVCDATGEPRDYTKRCYCKQFRKKESK